MRPPPLPARALNRASIPSTHLDPESPRDACGVGFIARTTGERSNDVLQIAVEALSRLGHRGAASADSSGDGAGILTQIPRRLLMRDARRIGVSLGSALDSGAPFALGSFFLPAESSAQAAAVRIVEESLVADGLSLLGWRDVPIDPAALGPTARASCPVLRHAFIGRPHGPLDEEAFERALYLVRRQMELRAEELALRGFYVCSLSCRTVVYKALLAGRQVPAFFLDFHEPDYETAVAVFHQRFSTNTLPSWELAHPFRLLAHNGEINTLWGNRNAMVMRGPLLDSPVWGDRIERIRDVIWREGSDSASLDNALELLVRSGRDPVEGMMMLLPQAWEKYPDVAPSVKAFYEYQQCLLEPWDGPAAVAFTDGVLAGAAVDRNGLRPCRYKVRRDGLVVVGSEVGMVDLDPRDIVETGSVGPGEVILVDFKRRALVRNRPAKREVATRKPYAQWVEKNLVTLRGDPLTVAPDLSPDERRARQAAAFWGSEDLKYVLSAMVETASEPIFSMGDDTAIPPLALEPRSIYQFFRQRFAQVTNPPIDPLRESMVMSLRMQIGRRGSPLVEDASAARMLRVEHPVLLADEMAGLRSQVDFSHVTLPALWEGGRGDALKQALYDLARCAEREVRKGTPLIVLSDREADRDRLPLPMLLALGAVRQHLVREGLRAQCGLVVETADAFDVHHLATLFGYGAEAVHPWLALESAAALYPDRADAGELNRSGSASAAATYRIAAEKGLQKVMSKIGISTLSSYCGGQTFEVLGLGAEVIDTCFAGTASPIGGLGFDELAEDAEAVHRAAYPDEGFVPSLHDYGRVRYRKGTETRAYSPPVVSSLREATKSALPAAYETFVSKAVAQPPVAPRDLLDFAARIPIPLEEVEPVEAILPRFVASAMSLGALSPEAHAALAQAMNRIGALSNSGEGGEDPERYRPLADGTRADNRIKQVASARFGVTAEYLVKADELEIKIVQGAKPGEGGQLPAHKVTGLIARLRHAVPGVALISPPPHHDIYSIEDLAQLIHDLKSVNPRARVGVKLVATTGVGTVASGCAKAFADYVLVAGANGGTGAAALSSLKYAGLPWEIGLAEAQAALIRNNLRQRVEVRTDGGLKTGRDVVIAALLGADRFGFGTAALIAIGCVMARQCHLNTCPTGIATQKEELRARFTGSAEQAIAYFRMVAEDVRRILAALGARSLSEVTGRNELLVRAERPESPRSALLDLSGLLHEPELREAPRRASAPRGKRPGLICLDEEILHDLEPCLDGALPFSGSYHIRSHHLSVGTRVAGTLAVRFGDEGLPDGRIRLRFNGYAGQSFGAFAVRGLSLDLEGEANDYVGKGLSGGEITLRPFRQAAYAAATHENQILGNTALYGATAGRLFAAGQAGIRFAVRNSGAVAVVEGAGNHACEYMTGGLVLILGRAGRNFGAGMSNGFAYVLDEDDTFESRLNRDMVELDGVTHEDERLLLFLIREHQRKTVSPRAAQLLERWERFYPLFRKVVPIGAGARERVEAIRTVHLEKAPLPPIRASAGG